MKKVTLFATLLSFMTTMGQTITIEAPKINFTGNQTIAVSRKISNPTNETACWYFTQAPTSDSQIVSNLRNKITNPQDTALSQRELLMAWMDISKTSFTNQALKFTWWQKNLAIFRKAFSLMGTMHSVHSMQCGDHYVFALTVLKRFEYFNFNDFQLVNVPGHSMGQIKNMNRWIWTDFDPGIEFGINRNPVSPNGYASIDDIRSDTMLISDFYTFNGRVLVDTTPEHNTNRSRYREVLSGSPMDQSPFDSLDYTEPLELDPIYKLSPHSEINMTLPSIMLAIDKNDSLFVNSLVETFDICSQQVRVGNNAYIDTLIVFLSESFRTPISTFLSNPFYFVEYNSANDQGKNFGEVFDYFWESTTPPKFVFTGNSPIQTTVGVDLMAPLLVTRVSTNGNTTVGDTSFLNQATFKMWDLDENNVVAPQVTPNQVNYLQTGTLPAGTWEIEAAVNGHFYNPLNDWGVEMVCGSLETNTYVSFLSSPVLLSTAITNINNKKPFPNPARDLLFSDHNGILFNLYGQEVISIAVGNNDISKIPSGIYFLNGKKIIICK